MKVLIYRQMCQLGSQIQPKLLPDHVLLELLIWLVHKSYFLNSQKTGS